jgi:hypothetical protein
LAERLLTKRPVSLKIREERIKEIHRIRHFKSLVRHKHDLKKWIRFRWFTRTGLCDHGNELSCLLMVGNFGSSQLLSPSEDEFYSMKSDVSICMRHVNDKYVTWQLRAVQFSL